LYAPLKRYTRYQGAIIQNNHILLINHCEHKTGRSYWIFPGGGIESGETEGECVQREMKEETNLDVRILSLLFDEPYYYHGRAYQRIKTYFCEPIKGEAGPGIEPEAASHKALLKRSGSTCAVMPIGTPCWSMTPLYIFPYNAFGENWFI
jgi:8-oxo-dGTP pyrophosphatase MutT (NUDIX family)